MGGLQKPIDRRGHGAWRAAWVMLAFLRVGVNSGIWRPATFPLHGTSCHGSCCQATLGLWSLFHRFQSTDMAALREAWCLIPCPTFGPTLGIWVAGHVCPSPLGVKGHLTKRAPKQKGSIPFQPKRLQILRNQKNTRWLEFEMS